MAVICCLLWMTDLKNGWYSAITNLSRVSHELLHLLYSSLRATIRQQQTFVIITGWKEGEKRVKGPSISTLPVCTSPPPLPFVTCPRQFR